METHRKILPCGIDNVTQVVEVDSIGGDFGAVIGTIAKGLEAAFSFLITVEARKPPFKANKNNKLIQIVVFFQKGLTLFFCFFLSGWSLEVAFPCSMGKTF